MTLLDDMIAEMKARERAERWQKAFAIVCALGSIALVVVAVVVVLTYLRGGR